MANEQDFASLLQDYIKAYKKISYNQNNIPVDSPIYKSIKALSPTDKAAFAIQTIQQHIVTQKRSWLMLSSWQVQMALNTLLQTLLRQKVAFSSAQLVELLRLIRTLSDKYPNHHAVATYPMGLLAKQIEKHVKANGMDDDLLSYLQSCLTWPEFLQTECNYHGTNLNKVRQVITQLVKQTGHNSSQLVVYQLPEQDVWGKYVNTSVTKLPPSQQQIFHAIFEQCLKASTGKPSQKFLQHIKYQIDELLAAEYKKQVLDWLTHLAQAEPIEYQHRHYGYTEYLFLVQPNATLAKGLVWSLSLFHDEASLRTLAALAQRCYRKIPGVGHTSGGLGNACVYALANSKGLNGLSHLVRLKMGIAQASTRNLIDNYLFAAAEKRGLTIAALEDLAVPDYGLNNAQLDTVFENYIARLQIAGMGKTTLQWIKPDGTLQKSIPASVKQKHAAKLKQLQTRIKEIKKTLTAQRDRIDRSYIHDRCWSYANFQTYYLDQGLMSYLTQHLIWLLEFEHEEIAALYQEDGWQTVTGEPVEQVEQIRQVRLWHPIHASAKQVLQWRQRLHDLHIQQPFKQAYREVYLLTEAELNTRTYSNRMAAHIVKQHQFSALAKQRGWRYSLQGAFDDGRDSEVALVQIPAYGLTAEYWVNELYADHDAYNETGIWLYVGTDQVRFVNHLDEVQELIDVPALVFSEIMRDVDLFVGVASVGNDPAWLDSGGERHRDYWASYSFGDLSEIAKTRKTVLETLLPKLKIRDVARIDGKFLRVQGHYHEYKIHIGSTNILMSPKDQYLCIVPDAKASPTTAKLFLPFAGDRGLSLLISKALLLANDDKITDRTILSQIRC